MYVLRDVRLLRSIYIPKLSRSVERLDGMATADGQWLKWDGYLIWGGHLSSAEVVAEVAQTNEAALDIAHKVERELDRAKAADSAGKEPTQVIAPKRRDL